MLSLCAFPQVLDMMDAKLEWTQRLGDAFLADAEAVMRTVQGLRLRAQQAGNLQSTAQQNVIVQERTIVIEPAQPEYVYVPVYNPEIIYGPWWAPAYRPWYWYPGPVWGYPAFPSTWGYAAGIFWGTAWAINSYNWGWCRPNWGGYNIYVDVHGHNPWVNRPYYRDRYANTPNWSHAPEHRRGVAYRDPGTAQRYRPANPGAIQTRENYRGRDVATGPGYGGGYGRPVPGAATGARPGPGSATDITRPAPGAATRPARVRPVAQQVLRGPPPACRRSPRAPPQRPSDHRQHDTSRRRRPTVRPAWARRRGRPRRRLRSRHGLLRWRRRLPPGRHPRPVIRSRPTAPSRGRKSSATPPAARRAAQRCRSPRRRRCRGAAAQAVRRPRARPPAASAAAQGGGQGGGPMRQR